METIIELLLATFANMKYINFLIIINIVEDCLLAIILLLWYAEQVKPDT